MYDFEFAFRLDILAAAAEHQADPEAGLLVVPVRIGECAECPWWSWCGPVLEAGSGDVSLLPGVGWREWRIHRDHGVTSRAALAALDHRTAALVAAGVDLRPVTAALGTMPDGTPLPDVIGGRRKAQLAGWPGRASTCSATPGRWPRAPPPTAMRRCGTCPSRSTWPGPRWAGHLPTGAAACTRVRVPRGDIEVDIDMENTEDGVYLWGALVSAGPGRAAERRRLPPVLHLGAAEPATPRRSCSPGSGRG